MRQLFFLLTVTLLLLSACSAKRNLNPLPQKIPDSSIETKLIEKTVIERDTVFQTKPDSTLYNALIECQNGIPILKSPIINKSKTGSINVDVSLQGNQLKVNATKEAEKLFAKWKEEHLKENFTKEIKTPYPVEVPHYIEKQLTWWQKLWINLGKISGLIISVFILIKIPWKSLRRLLAF